MRDKKPRFLDSDTVIGSGMVAVGVALTALGITAEVGIPLALIGGAIIASGQGVKI